MKLPIPKDWFFGICRKGLTTAISNEPKKILDTERMFVLYLDNRNYCST